MSDASPIRRIDRPVALSEEAYERIRRELLPGGELSGTHRLIERELAERLSMSRTPVRDALRRLELSGLVEPLPGGGYVRRHVTLREVDEHYELLEVLEPLAAAMAASTQADDLSPPFDVEPFTERDVTPSGESRWHMAIAEASGNAVLARVIATLNERLLATHRSFIEGDEEFHRAVAANHDAIVDALRRGDSVAAADEMRQHLAFARREVTRQLREDRR
jgi:DNA-binding GntR family transcriptional regulator